MTLSWSHSQGEAEAELEPRPSDCQIQALGHRWFLTQVCRAPTAQVRKLLLPSQVAGSCEATVPSQCLEGDRRFIQFSVTLPMTWAGCPYFCLSYLLGGDWCFPPIPGPPFANAQALPLVWLDVTRLSTTLLLATATHHNDLCVLD